MGYNHKQWDSSDFTVAMKTAIENHCDTKYFLMEKDKIHFNGFWRNGDKQNVCLWTNNATWHDVKTGDGGGCKEFAKTAFNMTLPDFMKRFGGAQAHRVGSTTIAVRKILDKAPESFLSKSINLIWSEVINTSIDNYGLALTWLEDERGFEGVSKFVGSGFTCLHDEHIEHFKKIHHDFLRHRLKIGNQLMVPLRSAHSEEIKNIVFRTISLCEKHEKTRLLPHAGGWSEADGWPRAFGFPHLIMDFPNLVLCEGMADYFAAECLLKNNEKYLPIGAANADALSKWAQWLIDHKYPGHITIVYHLDKNESGKLSENATGPLKASRALADLRKNGSSATLFDWLLFIENTTTHPDEINDLADSLKAEATHRECGPDHLPYLFLALLKQKEKCHG
jgi:hypothetical protein